MKTIYEHFDAAFGRVAAYTLHREGRFIGRIAFKYPQDGAGRLYCYAQVWGGPMTRASVSGGGYDKATAAAHNAVHGLRDPDRDPSTAADLAAVQAALSSDGGRRWTDQLLAQDIRVCQAIEA